LAHLLSDIPLPQSLPHVSTLFLTVSTNAYRGRIAPSPTGYLHIGHAHTFHRAWQRARQRLGVLVLRMEDLDPDRSRPEYAQAVLEDLHWLNIDWDEGPDLGGPYAPYEQSLRADVYRSAWEKLRERGFIYPCRCSRKDLAAALSAPHEDTSNPGVRGNELEDEPVYPGTCRPSRSGKGMVDLSPEFAYGPGGLNWRFRVPDGEIIEFNDANLGLQRFIAGIDFGDFLVWRREGPEAPRMGPRSRGGDPGSPPMGPRPWGSGIPSYQLACAADDFAMHITEVVRGADLLKSTARQILLNRALGYPAPNWFHCELIVDEQGRRLAKRHDALSIRELRRRGMSPSDIFRAYSSPEPPHS
jgi:glutamyl/glutaminyl-tRNA synthetase